MTALGIRALVSFGDTSLPQIEDLDPIASLTGSTKEWVARDLTTGDLVGSWADRRGGSPLISSGAARPVVMVESGKRFVRFDGVDDYLQDTGGTFSQPHTKVIRFRFQGTRKASESILGTPVTTTSAQMNVFINAAMTQYASFASATLITTAGGVNTNWHTLIAVFNGASSVLSIDGTEVSGATGSNTSGGTRLGRGSGSSTVFSTIDVQRVALLDHAADSTERAAILTAMAA